MGTRLLGFLNTSGARRNRVDSYGFAYRQVSGFSKEGPYANDLRTEVLPMIGNHQSGQSWLWPSGMEVCSGD